MFVVLLKFFDNKEQSAQHLEAHKAWLQQGFDDGTFYLAGSLQPGLGGAIIAHNISREELEERVKQDPFVGENVVDHELFEIVASKADERLSFLLG